MSLGLAASPGCDPEWQLPPLPCASTHHHAGVQSSHAARSNGLSVQVGEATVLLGPFRASTPLKTSRPVNVTTVSQGELRGERTREPEGFPLSTLLLENMHILKYVCSLSFSLGYFPPYILRIRFWVVLIFGFVSFWVFFICILTIQHSFFIIHRIVNGKCTWRWTGMKLQ